MLVQETLEAFKKVAEFGPSFKLPGPWKLANTLLKKEVERVQASLQEVLDRHKDYGWTLASDGFTDQAHRPLTNVVYLTASAPIFMRAEHAGTEIKNAEYLVNVLSKDFEDHGRNIVLVVTDSAAVCKAAGEYSSTLHEVHDDLRFVANASLRRATA